MSSPFPIPIDAKMLENVDEEGLQSRAARIENGYVNEEKGFTRFPMLTPWLELPASGRVYLEEWKGDMIAVCGGRTFRVDPANISASDVTGASVTGSGRVIFAETEDEKLMAAGGGIVKLKKNHTELLSKEAPESTHVAFISGYVIAIEPRSGRFYHTPVGQYSVWNPLDVFSAEGKPDDLTAALVTEFGELLLCGTESIEQFDSVASGSKPFFKRWDLGSGLYAPYSILSVDNRVWGLNQRKEFVSFTTQSADSESEDVQRSLENLDDYTDAWSAALQMSGQMFIVFQVPYATNRYGTKGVTFLYDYKKGRWSNLYGFRQNPGIPDRWPGWSIFSFNGVTYVGGEGLIYTLGGFGGDADPVQRMTLRTGHLEAKSSHDLRMDKLLVSVNRGSNPTNDTTPPLLSIRANKDNKGFGAWARRSLGRAGQRNMVIEFPSMGTAKTWQFEIQVTDRTPVTVRKVTAEVTELRS